VLVQDLDGMGEEVESTGVVLRVTERGHVLVALDNEAQGQPGCRARWQAEYIAEFVRHDHNPPKGD
jgi:hypothetical protein